MEWNLTDIELPPINGWYFVKNHHKDSFDLGSCFYDGFGFIVDNIYKEPKYWALPIEIKKRYGIMKEE